MNLLFIYGPPAVGKLTVARIISASTGYRLLHNHLAFDVAAAVFEPFSPPFSRMLQQVRMLAINSAISERVTGMILTMCYDHPSDEQIVEELHAAVEGAGGKVHNVHLVCSPEELRRRVAFPDRGMFRKLRSPEKLDAVLQKWELFTSLRNHPSLRIDSTTREPRSVAEEIVRHFGISAPSSG